jgi:DNA-binding response OmpR family regulator
MRLPNRDRQKHERCPQSIGHDELCALVSDLNLPDGDGLNLVVAEAKRLHGLKAIAVTGRTEAVERERGLRAGCDFYLTKPVDFHQLRCALGIPPHHSAA